MTRYALQSLQFYYFPKKKKNTNDPAVLHQTRRSLHHHQVQPKRQHIPHPEASCVTPFIRSWASRRGRTNKVKVSYNPSESQTPSPTSDDPLTAVFPDLTTTLAPAPILIRATNGKSKAARKRGKKVKLSTVVQPDELEAFYGRYAEVCRAGMSALKPRDRTKRKAKAKRRKGGASA